MKWFNTSCAVTLFVNTTALSALLIPSLSLLLAKAKSSAFLVLALEGSCSIPLIILIAHLYAFSSSSVSSGHVANTTVRTIGMQMEQGFILW